MSEQQKFELMVKAFEQAATDIEANRGNAARNRITNLPESVYELSLSYYHAKPLKAKKRTRDRYYYLTRYVLHFIEMQSVYCLYSIDAIPRNHTRDNTFKKGMQQLEVYRIAYRGLEKPVAVSVDHQVIIFNQLPLF